MSELQIFENAEFIEVKIVIENGKKEYLINDVKIDRFKLLAMACKEENKKNAWELMRIASIMFHPQDDKVFNCLYGAAAMDIARNFTKNEFYYHTVFKKNYSKIGDGKVVKNETNDHDIPDAWVERNGHIIPVEIKLGKFGRKALQQLNRYMKVYGSTKGIAVARELSIKLPKNVEFVSFSELEVANEK